MKHVNGDMDDLFRRASEKYPLRTDSADWDRLADSLDNGPEPPADVVEEKRRRRGIFWWFLLVPLAGLGYLAREMSLHQATGKGNPAAVRSAGASGQGGAATARPADAGGQGGVAAQPAGSGEQGGVATQASGGTAQGSVSTAQGSAAMSQGSVRTVQGYAAGQTVGRTGHKKVVTQRGGVAESGKTETVSSDAPGTADVAGTAGTPGTVGTVGTAGSVAGGGSADRPLVHAALDSRRAAIAGGYNVTVDVRAPAHGADSPNKSPQKSMAKSKTAHGYIGLLGAPDFSTVKFQSMKGVGTTFGLLLGYAFSDRWAVESGVYLDRKNYYTAGEYFNTKNVRISPNYTLLNVDGTCYMWEIPLNVRYNFTTGPRMKWFATAGLSTYLMTKENYTYEYEYSNWNSPQDSAWKINKPSQYWFSVVNLSIGFEQRVGKIGNFRLEPYVRLPLSGIGTGRLPIMSAGLNIGFTRQLW